MNAYFPFSYIITALESKAPAIVKHPYFCGWHVGNAESEDAAEQAVPAISEIYYS
ncbi:MAG: hypothetical protein K2L16_03380 [Muribaculaceae bacterium]|nr:hypothetical protein [Muribaculaceae bacterium]